MVSCRLGGGLGNLMFQIAGTEYISKSSGFESGYWNIDSVFRGLNGGYINADMNHANDYLNIFKNFHWPKCNKPATEVHVPFHYVPIEIKDDIEYVGYFQSEQYFPDRDFILNLFQPSEMVNIKLSKYNKILEGNTCSIHIRRGDYLKAKNSIHAVRDLTYYQKGINAVGEVDRYLIFSDDLDWCKENFIGDKFTFIENEKDYVELFLQSQCNHNIISSSSFSWWGAYLNNKPHRKIVGPNEWFTNCMKNDIVPKGWITI